MDRQLTRACCGGAIDPTTDSKDDSSANPTGAATFLRTLRSLDRQVIRLLGAAGKAGPDDKQGCVREGRLDRALGKGGEAAVRDPRLALRSPQCNDSVVPAVSE